MNLRLLTPALLAFALAAQAENEVGFIERFALAPDREKVLTELVPGTEDYYFFHALHYQNTKQAPKLATTLEQWSKRFPDSPRRKVIENREALLAYDTDPKRTLEFLRTTLNLQFNHVQEVRDQKPDLPTQLDPAAIARDVFRKEALQDDDLGKFSPEALADLVIDKVPLRPAQRRALLQGIQRPNIPGLVELIAAELKTPENPSFGEFPIHSQLLPEQLDALARLVPRIATEQEFVFARIRKLAPGADEDAEFDPAAREAWLDRVWAYAKTLPPAYNSLKAAVLYRRLDHDRRKGVYDAARFTEYLRLPRQTPYAAPKWVERLSSQNVTWVDLNASFSEAGLAFAPISSDEALVREYFIQLFAAAGVKARWEDYAELVHDTWLKPVFAEAMIVNGIGDPERWASLLKPAAYQRLKERVDLDFVPENAVFFPPADAVSIDVWVKNAPKLIVKVYELNALNYFLTNKRQLNTDLPLDGLVANSETTQTYDDAPLRRIRRNFSFPELKGRRGAWVIELIGGGRSSRALIRKGQWHVVQQTGPAGDLLTVLDEQQNVVKDAVIWLDGRKLAVDPTTFAATVPFTAQPGTKEIVLADPAGTFATLTEFEHHAEEYRLDAQFQVEREQLLAGREATVAIRAALRLQASELSMSLLKDPKLTVTTTTLDGITTTHEVTGLQFDAAKVLLHKLRVPERLASLSMQLSGDVEQIAKGGEKLRLTADASWQVNGMDRTEAVFDGHLARADAGYSLELLGKDGEPIPDRQVVFTFSRRGFQNTRPIALRTDARGRIALGSLDQIDHLSAQLPDGRRRNWQIEQSTRTTDETIQVAEGAAFQVPLQRLLPSARFALFEVKGETFSADLTKRIEMPPAVANAPAGGLPFITVSGLPGGDYRLFLPDEDRSVEIKVAKGTVVAGWVHGSARALQLTPAKPLNLAKVEATPAEVIVTLANVTPFTRVHIAATRYVDLSTRLAELMDFDRIGGGMESPARLPNLYAAGRDIGDEYRYILERRYSLKYPGNLLSRPGLILNPWEKRTTDQVALDQKAMQQAGATAGDRARKAAPGEAAPEPAAAADADGGLITSTIPTHPNLDFFAATGPVVYNLVPDKDGVVRVDRKLLGDRQLVQIYAEDLRDAVWKEVALPDVQPQLKELRLTRGLDPAKPFAEKKEITVLTKGQTLTLPDLLTSELETYDTFGSVFSLYLTLSGNDTLAKFAWIMEWPTMKDEDKRAKYSEFACHELNFLLSRKDPDFFAKVVQPYLRNKKEKTFMDDYLIGADLRRYLEPWRFAQLNAAERALLISRLPDGSAGIARHLREIWELLPPNPNELDKVFETALRGRAMDEGSVALLGFAAAKETQNLWAAQSGAIRGFGDVTKNSIDELIVPPATSPAGGRAAGGAGFGGGLAVRDEADKKVSTLATAVDSMSALGESERYARETRLGVEVAFLDDRELDRKRGEAKSQAYYRRLGPAKEWAENNYYHLPIEQQNAQLIPVNAFWRDFAAWMADGAKAPFLSANFAEAHRNFSEMMLALAVLDLPFSAEKQVTKTDGPAFTVTAAGPLLAVHKQIKPAAAAPDRTELLVSQNFYRRGDRYRQEGNEKFDKYVNEEFLAGAVYGANIVVTNPSSAPQKLDLLLQIPRGALPVLGSKATDSKAVRLEPFTTQSFEYFFYFPLPNAAPDERFAHYPVVLAKNEQVVGAAKPFSFHVVGKLSQVDKASWDYVSQYGSEADVLAFLEQNNIERLDLARVAWRCRQNVDFYRKLVAMLAARHHFDPTIYSYAVVHNDTPTLSEWLRHRDDLLDQCGPWLNSTLVKIDPIERKRFEQLDYSPVVNQRTHRLGAEYRIPNPVILGQYRGQLDIISYKPAPEPMDVLSVVGFLFLQDRAEEALARLKAVNTDALVTRIQLDYLRCYADFYEANLADARGIANQYTNFPVARWRNLFADVIAQADEIEGKAGVVQKDTDKPDRERETADAANTAPAFDFKVEDRTIALTWRNLGEATLNYYLIDPEFSFSSNPFVSEDASRFAIIRPTQTAVLPLPKDKDSMEIPLPGEFAKANVVVEIVAAGQRKAQAYHANTLKMNLVENYGRLELREKAAGKPVPKAYVKVYARLNNGTVRFFKDGYTDLRGKFDYASLNSADTKQPPPQPVPLAGGGEGSLNTQMLKPTELDQVARLSILVLSESNGALVREVAPPRE